MSVVRRAIKAALRSLAVCIVSCLAGLAAGSPAAFGEGVSPGEGAGASSSLASPLVIPGSPTEGEQAHAAEEAERSSPEAVAEREASTTKFENLGEAQAREEDATAFPKLIDEPAGGPPKLPAGQSITGFLSDTAAAISLGNGQAGVVESVVPMALETSPGRRTPVDLGLNEVGGAFEPKTPFVPVQIAKRLGEGVMLGSTGVSLTPVGAQGSSLGGSEGVVDGASVLYANTQTDADTVVKPTIAGFEADTTLRSIESPRELYFRVGLPAGARLIQEESTGAAKVVKEGVAIATIPRPGRSRRHGDGGASVDVCLRGPTGIECR